MSVLHMETSVARTTQSTMTATGQHFIENLQTMNNAMESLRANWQGNSASQFLQEYDQLRTALATMFESVNSMSVRLNAEIDQWEQTAASA